MDSDAARLGRYGSVWCKDLLQHTATTGTFYCAFLFPEATVFGSLGFFNGATYTPSPGTVAAVNTNCTFAGGSSVLASMSFAAGTIIYGMWTSFALASGSCIAYKVASKAAYANG
jgi:hypothetical protein